MSSPVWLRDKYLNNIPKPLAAMSVANRTAFDFRQNDS
jgi:hypothetical protein